VRFKQLNPADHFTLMMDHEIRKSGLAGNFCAVVLELEGCPDRQQIETYCRNFPARFPRSVARLRQSGRRFAWETSVRESLPLHLHDLPAENGGSGEQQLCHIVNTVCPVGEAAPLEVHLLRGTQRSLLVLKWFHPACDAKGIELVLHHLFRDDTVESVKEESVSDALLQRWSLWQKIKLGLKARKNIATLDRAPSILPEAGDRQPDALAVRLQRFDAEESRCILAYARKTTGLTGTAVYFIGCMMRALEQVGCPREGEAYLVPYAVNVRRSRALYPVFGNQVSFLFAQATRELVTSRERLFAHLMDQNRASVRARLDQAMVPLMQAASWLPLEKYGSIVRFSPHGRERSSFWFSYTGAMDPEPTEIGDCPVSNMYQVSQVTAPPALGLLVSSFHGRLTLSLNYARNQFTPVWIGHLMTILHKELLPDGVSA